MGRIGFLFVLFVALFSASSLQAQKNTLVGQVTTFGNIPVEKAEITVHKSKLSTQSNSKGEYSIECNKKDKLIIRANGFKQKKIKAISIKDTLKTNLIFLGGKTNIEECVRVGHVKKSDLLHAIKHRSVDNVEHVYASILEMILHKKPEVTIDNSGVYIRGGNEYTGKGEALIVIDDVISDFTDLQNFSVYDVGKIEVVKGADAVMYGGQAAYGALVITSKNE